MRAGTFGRLVLDINVDPGAVVLKTHLISVTYSDILTETGEEIDKLFGFVHCCSYLLMNFVCGE